MSNIAVLNPALLRRSFQLDTFLETGCFRGDSMALAYAAGFPKVISCDINPDNVAACRQRFPEAEVLEAESTEMLGPRFPEILPGMGKTLFWLDAHFAILYGHDETDRNRFPLAEELRLIRDGKPDYIHDVIAFDDLRVIRDPANPRYRQGELTGDEASLYVDITLKELLEPFAASHEATVVHAQEGSVVLLPRSVTARLRAAN